MAPPRKQPLEGETPSAAPGNPPWGPSLDHLPWLTGKSSDQSLESLTASPTPWSPPQGEDLVNALRSRNPGVRQQLAAQAASDSASARSAGLLFNDDTTRETIEIQGPPNEQIARRRFTSSGGKVTEAEIFKNPSDKIEGVEITRGDSGGPDIVRPLAVHRVLPNEWRTRLMLVASWRNIVFEMEGYSLPVGRRTFVHEYPQRDSVFVEDAGKVTKIHRITGFVLGDDYDERRDNLVSVLEQAGDGELIHPYLGKRICRVLEPSTLSEQVRDQRIARFEMAFVEVPGETSLTVADDFAELTFQSADLARTTAEDSWTGVESKLLANLTSILTLGYRAYKESVGKTLALILGVSEDTLNFPDSFSEFVKQLGTLGQLITAVLEVPPPSPLLSDDELEAAYPLSTWVKTELLARATEIAATTDFETRPDSVLAANSVLEPIKVEEAAAVDPEVYARLVDLRIHFAKVMLDLGRVLPRVRIVNLDRNVPSYVLSYGYYGTADRADEIVRRNAITHPLFISGDIEIVIP